MDERAFGYMRVATADQIDSGLKTKEEERGMEYD